MYSIHILTRVGFTLIHWNGVFACNTVALGTERMVRRRQTPKGVYLLILIARLRVREGTWRNSSCLMYTGATTSGLEDTACPIFTNAGPRTVSWFFRYSAACSSPFSAKNMRHLTSANPVELRRCPPKPRMRQAESLSTCSYPGTL